MRNHHENGNVRIMGGNKISKCWRLSKVPLLILCYVGFLLVGALIITTTEADADITLKNKRRNELLAIFQKYNFSTKDQRLREFLRAAFKASQVDALKLNNLEKELGTTWGFNGGLFFTASLITTVGYGNKYPRTKSGRWFCMLYALIGVPFTAILLTTIAQSIVRLIRKTDPYLMKIFQKHSDIDDEKKIHTAVRIIQMVTGLALFLFLLWLIPALIMIATQGWDISTSMYFCFITISTIGLGDITPEMSVDPLNFDDAKDNPIVAVRQLSTILYIIVSLIGVTIMFSLASSIRKQLKKKKTNKHNKDKKTEIETKKTILLVEENSHQHNEAINLAYDAKENENK